MNRTQSVRWVVLIAAVFCILVSSTYAQQNGKKEHIFRGKVEKVDAQAKMLTINGEKVEGWMAAMTMGYRVDNDAVFKQVKVGDTITAKVYDGDLVLHDVKVVPASGGNSSDKSGSQAPQKVILQ